MSGSATSIGGRDSSGQSNAPESRPTVLYKYVPAERIDILENLRIRFTQPNAMNDPFEARPDFYMTEAGRARELANVIRQSPISIWSAGRTVTQAEMEREAYAVSVERNPDCAEQMYARGGIQIPLDEIAKKVYDEVYNSAGILSLSETPYDLLMWAHYAEGHRGFVIMLDGLHDFFKDNRPVFGFEKPERVEYSSDRPRMQINDPNMPAIFFTKGTPWKYEKEWRYLKEIEDADVLCQQTNALPVALFRLPPKCIEGVILGCYRDQKLRDNILALRRKHPELRHLRVHEARASKTEYRLRIEEIKS